MTAVGISVLVYQSTLVAAYDEPPGTALMRISHIIFKWKISGIIFLRLILRFFESLQASPRSPGFFFCGTLYGNVECRCPSALDYLHSQHDQLLINTRCSADGGFYKPNLRGQNRVQWSGSTGSCRDRDITHIVTKKFFLIFCLLNIVFYSTEWFFQFLED